MDEISRREAAGVAALAGVIAIVGTSPKSALATEKPISEVDEQAERQRVITCGLTGEEADCWILVSEAAAKFFQLPKMHPMDEQEVAQAIHVVQQKLLSRPAYRRYQELLAKQK